MQAPEKRVLVRRKEWMLLQWLRKTKNYKLTTLKFCVANGGAKTEQALPLVVRRKF